MSTSTGEVSSVSTSGRADPIHINFLRESREDVFKKYETLEILGEGSMGYVSKVKIKTSKIGGSAFQPKINGPFPWIRGLFHAKGKPRSGLSDDSGVNAPVYALKMIQLDRISPMFLDELKNEIAILKAMDHPNIVRATEVYVYRKQIYIIMEACEGGDLHTQSPYSEHEAASITTQLLSAIKYMHEQKIVHRDLKYENIMFSRKARDSPVKVIDFGLSKKFLNTPGVMTDRVGTVYTMAPQVLQGIYSSQADLWAAGVITYMLLSATKPFNHKRRRKMIDLIMRADYNFNEPVWGLVSGEAKEFVSSLLVIDPDLRLTATTALDHPWIVNREKLGNEIPPEDLLMSMPGCLLRFKDQSNFKKLALNVIAHRSTTAEIVELRTIFQHYDTTNNGEISYDEFKAALEKANYFEEQDMQEIYASIDLNKNGCIDYTEFLAATIEAHGHIEERRIAEAFDRMDSDGSGYISKQCLSNLLGKEYTREFIDALVADVDTDGDGRVSYAEFLALFRQKTEENAVEVVEQSECADGEHTAGSVPEDLVGLNAKIPGGRFDSNLDSILERMVHGSGCQKNTIWGKNQNVVQNRCSPLK